MTRPAKERPTKERQITSAASGHILTNIGCWSRDGQWLVYDTRSDAAGSQFDGRFIERVEAASGRVERLFSSQREAHCGVVTCCPRTDRVVFILGPESPTMDWQYAAWHRRGVIVDCAVEANVRVPVALDAMCYAPPFVAGALRGGSHVHTFDPQGLRVSYTYEDHLLATLDRAQHPQAERNQRNVGISIPGHTINVPKSHARNSDGTHFSALVTSTVDQPVPGSDEIDRAYEDGWLGQQGRALAFLGDVVGRDGARFTELFLLELPEDMTQPGALGPLEGTATTRPCPPLGCQQRRLTFTEERSLPGICGPRHWPRSTPDGSTIFCLMPDTKRQAQLWSVSLRGGASGRDQVQDPIQLTRAADGVRSCFSVSADGQWIAYIAEGCVMVTSVDGHQSRRLTEPSSEESAPRPEACVFSPVGTKIAYVRRIRSHSGLYNQIFTVDV